jgi:hypothetical protein
MARKKPDPEITLLLKIIDQAFDKQAWHGPTLRGSLRGITAKQALWRPGKGRPNIWEYALHAAYWKCMVRRRVTGKAEVKFPRKGSNFPQIPKSPNDVAWKKDIQLLQQEHSLLRETIAALPKGKLYARSYNSRYTNAVHIYGIASHDLYHAGQIQLLKRLQRGTAKKR